MTHMAEDKNADVTAMPFEAALAELERIVTDLERGEVPLEKSVEMYERGEKLKARCEALLRQAEERVEKIRIGPGGKAEGTEPLDVE
jgi:exodeoxyribonuclease VII small subunit